MSRLRCFALLFLCTSTALYPLTTYHVSASTDNAPGTNGEPGDLRYCLNQMNNDLNDVNTTPDDCAIIFDFPMTIQLNGILPIINNSSFPVNITIGNSGSIPTVTIDGSDGSYPGLFIAMGNVTIQNMIFQNMTAMGGRGGNGISGGGGGMGAGGAIYVPTMFLNGSYPDVTLINVQINNCNAVGGDGGSWIGDSLTGNEGGGGGGGFGGNGGSIIAIGMTGGAGGGGFGGDGGDVTTSTSDMPGGGGGGGGGIGSRATTGTLSNLGNGGSDVSAGQDGNGYGLTTLAGSGAGGYAGGIYAGGGGGGTGMSGASDSGGGGGGSQAGSNGLVPQGSITPGGGVPSGGSGSDGGGGGGAGVVITKTVNHIDGQAGTGGYAGGGGGGAGVGAVDDGYTVQGGNGGLGGGGGGGGAEIFGNFSTAGGDSSGGGGGGGGGPSNVGTAFPGGSDIGGLGGGAGGSGANQVGAGFGGGGGGGGSGLGGAIFVDRGLMLTIQAIPDVPTTFNTANCQVDAGQGGDAGDGGGEDGQPGSARGSSIFLRENSGLLLRAEGSGDILILGEGVSFVDQAVVGPGNTSIQVRGDGTVVYNGTSDYAGTITINNATFQLNGTINDASVNVCRNDTEAQRGTLSGNGSATGDVFVNSGTIAPDVAETLSLGSLTLRPAVPIENTLGSLVRIAINDAGTALVNITNAATLAGVLELDVDESVSTGTYTILSTGGGITGTFDSVQFSGAILNYTLSYLPVDSPTYVEVEFLGVYIVQGVSNLKGKPYALYNELTWVASPSLYVTGYNIYRDGTLLDTVSSATVSYQDADRPVGVSTAYSITTVYNTDSESSPVSVTVTSY